MKTNAHEAPNHSRTLWGIQRSSHGIIEALQVMLQMTFLFFNSDIYVLVLFSCYIFVVVCASKRPVAPC